MAKNDLKKLRRQDLLELLIAQEKEIQQLNEELETLRKQVQERQIRLDKAGSIAEAALALNSVFEAAEAAAAQYLDSVRVWSEEQPKNVEVKQEGEEKESETKDSSLLEARTEGEGEE